MSERSKMEARRRRARVALSAARLTEAGHRFAAARDGRDDEEQLVGLLTDLAHWARSEGVDFDAAVETATIHEAFERAEYETEQQRRVEPVVDRAQQAASRAAWNTIEPRAGVGGVTTLPNLDAYDGEED